MNHALENPNSVIFPNQVVDGRDPELYPKKEPEIPRRYHNYLKEDDKKNIYGDKYVPPTLNTFTNLSGNPIVVLPKSALNKKSSKADEGTDADNDNGATGDQDVNGATGSQGDDPSTPETGEKNSKSSKK